jgi:sulfide:quinone oxidoreductase
VSRVVVLGAGIAGHTAAAFARRWLGREHTVIVVSPRPDYNWVPSNIWVGVGLLKPAKVTFPLAPVYERAGIEFVQATGREIHPEGELEDPAPYVVAEAVDGTRSKVRYDFLINATGPALRFDKTEGLGPDGGNSLSVCLPQHAAQAAAALDEEVDRMRRGDKRRFLVGIGHGTCTCEGAAFEYIVNLEFELRNRGVRDRAEIVWITNEYELGDFGMGGMHLKRSGYVTPSSIFNASLFAERGIDWITRAHVYTVEPGRVLYETLEGTEHEQQFDFAMLLPPFSGVGLNDGVPDRARLPALPRVRSRSRPHLRRDRAGWSLDQDPAAPPVPPQGTAPSRLEPDTGVAAWTTKSSATSLNRPG